MDQPIRLTPKITSTLSFPELIDYHLDHNPSHPFGRFPAADPNADPDIVTYLEYARATHRVARALCAGGAVPAKTGAVVGFVANADSLMYTALVGGLARAGLTAFPISPRMSAPAICHMIRKTATHRLLISRDPELVGLVDAVQKDLDDSGYELSLEEIPAFETIFPKLAHETAADPFERIPLPAQEVFVNNVVIYIHSSGSTGLPKPIPWTVRWIQAFTWVDLIESLYETNVNVSVAAPGVPPVGFGGILCSILQPLVGGRPGSMLRPAYPAPPIVSSPATMLAALKAVRATATLVSPTFLEVWVHEPASVEYLKTLSVIFFGGGPLVEEVGDTLVRAGCTLREAYGGTEFGLPGRWFLDPRAPAPSRSDWAWTMLGRHVCARWVPQHGSATFELQLLSDERQVLALEDLPDVRGFSTKDLFIQHPSEPGLWKMWASSSRA